MNKQTHSHTHRQHILYMIFKVVNNDPVDSFNNQSLIKTQFRSEIALEILLHSGNVDHECSQPAGRTCSSMSRFLLCVCNKEKENAPIKGNSGLVNQFSLRRNVQNTVFISGVKYRINPQLAVFCP